MRRKRKGKKKTFAFLGGCLLFITAWVLFRIINAPPLVASSRWEDVDFDGMSTREALEWLETSAQASLEERKPGLETLATRRDAIGYLANLTLGEALSGEEEYAVGYLQQALALHDTKEIRLKLAMAMLQEGEVEEAKALFFTLLPNEAAMEQLTLLGISPKEIGEGLIKGKHYEALLAYHLQLEEGDQESLWALAQRAHSQGALGNYQEALALFESVRAQGGTLQDTELWWYGRSLEALGKEKEAIQVYQALGKEGAYRLGMLLEKQGSIQAAAAVYETSPEEVSRWKGAKLYEQVGNWSRALEIYQQLAREEGNYRYDAAYRAYILMDRHQIEGKEEMVVYLQTQPAWMHRIGKEMQWHMEDTVPETVAILDKLEEYRQMGRNDLAEIELSIIAKQGTPADQIALGEYYLAQGQYSEGVKWGIRALKNSKEARAYRLSYQRPYEDLVLKAAETYGVDPYLIWAVMREESHFQADAQSWVGAMGLMQIMPATGEEIASRLKVTLNPGQLLEPETNITFGAFYLSRLLKQFDGNLDKALAAYNGGQGNVRKWEKSPLGTAPEDFPTAVTFYETQQYITKVTNTYLTYRWLYEGER